LFSSWFTFLAAGWAGISRPEREPAAPNPPIADDGARPIHQAGVYRDRPTTGSAASFRFPTARSLLANAVADLSEQNLCHSENVNLGNTLIGALSPVRACM
jgi:hypothetical protein